MQTAIVTGGDGGLGYKCARAIAAAWPQWHVIIASHDYAKSTEAVRSIIDGSRPQCAELALNPYVNHATAATTIFSGSCNIR